ncbi:MAG TPA: hypothetical protein PLM62_15585 [Zoogloea sp.]|nr:hypothetical protein [Zoogloea sp.]
MSNGPETLVSFLAASFSSTELRELVRSRLGLAGLNEIPSEQTPPLQIAFAVLGVLERHGCVDESFFLALERARPRLRKSIKRLQKSQITPDGSNSQAMQRERLRYAMICIGAALILIPTCLADVPFSKTFVSYTAGLYLFGLAAGANPRIRIMSNHIQMWLGRMPENAAPPEQVASSIPARRSLKTGKFEGTSPEPQDAPTPSITETDSSSRKSDSA